VQPDVQFFDVILSGTSALTQRHRETVKTLHRIKECLNIAPTSADPSVTT